MREIRISPGVVQVPRPRPRALEGLKKTDRTTSFPAAERVNRPTPFEGFYEDRVRLVEERTAKLNELLAVVKIDDPAFLGCWGGSGERHRHGIPEGISFPELDAYINPQAAAERA
jgi:hypothetical protein